MLRNYFKIALRNLLRSKVFSLINIVGLAIGLTCSMLIASFIVDELSYDTFPEHHKNIYRIGLQITQNGGVDDYAHVDIAVAAGMKNTFPEVLASTRVTGKFSDYVSYGDLQFKETSIVLADSNFLTLFSIPLIEGNDDKALAEPNSVVITKAFARKYFGDKPALGELLKFTRNGIFKVTGVIEKVPDHAHFHYDAFLSMTTNKYIINAQTWSNVGFYSYLLLNEHANPKELEGKFIPLIEKYVVPEVQNDMGVSLAEAQRTVNSWHFYLMPLTDIHLHSATKYEMEANGDINYIYIFGVLALFIMLLAGINFTNLSTASSAKRAREVGIRKALGSLKDQLIYQFLMESIVLSLGAVLVSLIFVFALLPFFNPLTGKHIDMTFFLNGSTLGILFLVGLVVGIMAGIYPAFFLSSFETIRVLKGNSTASNTRGGLRSMLVVFQFAISTALIIATLVVYQQLHFMQTMKLGYNKDQVLVIENAGALEKNEQAFKQKLMQDHRVSSASISNHPPVGSGINYGGSEVFGKGNTTGTIHSTLFWIDHDYLETLGMNLIAGRNFLTDFPGDSSAVIINDTAMRDLGWKREDVVGRFIVRSGQVEYNVVGVVADFHYASARQKIAPLMMLRGNNRGSLLVKVNTHEMKSFIEDIQKQWTAFNANTALDYYFLDDQFAHTYQAEQTTEHIFIVFVIIAIVIACLGLYGLSTYSAEQRVKEIGIRKVLGSTVQQILFLLSKEFLVLVLMAIVIAVPITWWCMNQWLQNFGYHINISVWVFLLAALLAVSIALVTVSVQAIKAAIANPVKSLRAE